MSCRRHTAGRCSSCSKSSRLIRDYGIPLLEGLVLRVATPLPIVGATGSPGAPVAAL